MLRYFVIYFRVGAAAETNDTSRERNETLLSSRRTVPSLQIHHGTSIPWKRSVPRETLLRNRESCLLILAWWPSEMKGEGRNCIKQTWTNLLIVKLKREKKRKKKTSGSILFNASDRHPLRLDDTKKKGEKKRLDDSIKLQNSAIMSRKFWLVFPSEPLLPIRSRCVDLSLWFVTVEDDHGRIRRTIVRKCI